MRPVRAGPPKDTVFCLTFLLEQEHFISSGCLWAPKEKLREQNWGRNRTRAAASYPQNPTWSEVTVTQEGPAQSLQESRCWLPLHTGENPSLRLQGYVVVCDLQQLCGNSATPPSTKREARTPVAGQFSNHWVSTSCLETIKHIFQWKHTSKTEVTCNSEWNRKLRFLRKRHGPSLRISKVKDNSLCF